MEQCRIRSTHLFFLSRHALEAKWAAGSFFVPTNVWIIVTVCIVGLAPTPSRVSVDMATTVEARRSQSIYVHALARFCSPSHLQQLRSRILAHRGIGGLVDARSRRGIDRVRARSKRGVYCYWGVGKGLGVVERGCGRSAEDGSPVRASVSPQPACMAKEDALENLLVRDRRYGEDGWGVGRGLLKGPVVLCDSRLG